jgi:hypothetical protein
MRRSGIGWLVALCALGCAMTIPAGPAQALTYGFSCEVWEGSAEAAAQLMPLPSPANGATVTVGTPVTFSGESNHATFSIAANTTASIDLALNETARALLSAAHGHLGATLTILETSLLPSQTQTQSVHLEQRHATNAKRRKK